jgi:hypothetical protein
MAELIRRKTGAQPGNQNARKHGFYSQALARAEKHVLASAVGVDGLDQEIAIMRLKFRSLLAQDGQNLRLINQTAETLARLYQVKYSLTRTDVGKLKAAFDAVFSAFIVPEPPAPGGQDSPQPPPPSAPDVSRPPAASASAPSPTL